MPKTKPKKPTAQAAVDALHDGDAEQLQALLSAGLDPNTIWNAQEVQVNDGLVMVYSFAVNGGLVGTVSPPLLFLAAQFNQPRCAKVLLDARADPNGSLRDARGNVYVPLEACFSTQRRLNMPSALDIAADLIAAHADPNTAGRSPDGCTQLMLACEQGDRHATRFLLDHGADPNLGKDNGSSALFKAAQFGRDGCVALLIGARANLEKPFRSGCTPLGAAAGSGRADCVRLLLNARADKNVVAHSDNSTPLTLARQNGDLRSIELLSSSAWSGPPEPAYLPGQRVTIHGLVARPELNGELGTVQEYDGFSGRYGVALYRGGHMALKPSSLQGVSTDAVAARAVTASIPVTLPELNELLLTRGCSRRLETLLRRRDCDPDGPIPSESANEAGNPHPNPNPHTGLLGLGATATLLTRASLLQLKPVKTEATGIMPTRQEGGPAAASGRPVGQPQLLRALLNGGASVNAPAASGATPLHVAAYLCQLGNVKCLLEAAADVNAVCTKGTTPLHQAVADWEIPAEDMALTVRALLETGRITDVDARDANGFSALATAVEHGAAAPAIRALLDHGASVNLEVKPGFNSLAIACNQSIVPAPRETVRLLLEAKVDTNTSWADPTSTRGMRRTTREWAKIYHLEVNSDFRDELSRHPDFDYEAQQALQYQLVDAARLDAMTDRIARGEVSEAEVAASLKSIVDMARIVDSEREKKELQAASQQLVAAMAHTANDMPDTLTEPSPSAALPKGPKAVHGGRVQVR